MMTNSEIRRTALRKLDGHWGDLVLVTLLYAIIASIVQSPSQIGQLLLEEQSSFYLPGIGFPLLGGGIVLLLLALPLEWGLKMCYLRCYREEPPSMSALFSGFNDFFRIFSTIFLQQLYTLLWSLLLIVPGVVKALSYALVPYILKDRPDLARSGAIRLSREMMSGNKGRLFLLLLSFLGWGVLALFTCGIGFLWLLPYVGVSMAAFYEDAKQAYEQRTRIDAEAGTDSPGPDTQAPAR